MDVTTNNIRKLRETFEMFDENKDGTISPNELNKVLKCLNYNLTEAEAKRILKDTDIDENGKLDFEEFYIMIQSLVKHSIDRSEAVIAFQTFDPDKTGSVQLQELRNIFKMLGDNINEREIDEMLLQADINEDGTIDYEDFIDFIFKDSLK